MAKTAPHLLFKGFYLLGSEALDKICRRSFPRVGKHRILRLLTMCQALVGIEQILLNAKANSMRVTRMSLSSHW